MYVHVHVCTRTYICTCLAKDIGMHMYVRMCILAQAIGLGHSLYYRGIKYIDEMYV